MAFADGDERLLGWRKLGATPDDLRNAIGVAQVRRQGERSGQPINVGLLSALLPDAIAARTGRSSPGPEPGRAGPWHTSWAGIVDQGRTLGLEQGEHETCPDFKLRVLNAAGDGPWWNDQNRAVRNAVGPISVGRMLERER
ncbi:hypothetical protein F3J11_03630 [Burkholderia sp. Cy-647]|nr:hypothetical protein [Burkholderia sp. Tr-860]NIF61795.1 hypothetical protein [Burkholderia sp. Cy-647]NIF94936.1 hypothetical protein [Burkholderia sp. Ax-1720]